jgi:hypothetical protein
MCVKQQDNIESRMNATMIRLIFIGNIVGTIGEVIWGISGK